MDTEFAVEVDEQSVKVSSVKGRVILENGDDQQMKLINSKEAAKLIIMVISIVTNIINQKLTRSLVT